MTYREKLQKEHPEYVKSRYAGGCRGCPYMYGYEASESCPCEKSKEIANQPASIRCTDCWDRVIPGTEEKEYENLSRDELITLIKLLEGRIEIKDRAIANYIAACEDKNTQILNLSAIGKSKDAIIEKQEKEIKVLKADNAAADIMIEERDQKIQKLEGACSAYNAEVNRLNGAVHHKNDIIEKMEHDLKRVESDRNYYKELASRPCCCKPDVIAEKDKEIERLKKSLGFEISHKDFWYDEYLRLSKKVGELVNSNQELKDALEEEKKEHAKHHGIFRIFYD